MRRLFAIAAALALLSASPALAQAGGTPSNTAALWGQDSSTGLPCIVAPVGGSATCVLPTAGNGGATNFTPSQVSVTSTATQIVAARTGRRSVTVENTGTTPVYLGGASVTTSTGLLLPGVAGASLTVDFAGALYGITATGSAALTAYELY